MGEFREGLINFLTIESRDSPHRKVIISETHKLSGTTTSSQQEIEQLLTTFKQKMQLRQPSQDNHQ